MSDSTEVRLSFTEMFDLPVSVDLRTARRALGIGSTTAYRLLRDKEFPCPVVRVGRRYMIATTELMRAMGIENSPLYKVDLVPDADGSDTQI
ncbi:MULTISPECIES: helix-turn-helix domain-containing protein [unclassified Streptomyces]|uniref:helix-turn-helix domain-containing protein n=1 Tax=unclassified Streptomyces TaxID=2593676 RepID=UPI0037F9892E